MEPNTIPAVAQFPQARKPSSGEPKTIQLKQHLGLVAALVRNALLTYLAGMGRTVLSYEPMRFIARNDLLRQIEGISPPDWLAVRLLFEVAIRPLYFFKQEPFIAALVDVRTTRLIERTVCELIEDGLSLEGFLRWQARAKAMTRG